MKISFNINGTPKTVEVDGKTPLLWVIRDMLDLKGTKFGCGKAACGACTIHVDGEAIRSCSYATKFAEGKKITDNNIVNICRCATYYRMRKAIHRAAELNNTNS